jgi:hypothetical protein
VDCKDGLQELLALSGIKTKEEFAKRLGLPRSTSLTRYFPGGEYRGKILPPDLVDKLMKNIAHTGSPPVTPDKILELSGITNLTTTESSRSIVGYNAAMATGCFIPVLSIGDAMTIKIEEGKALVLSPIEHALSDRNLDGDEIAIRLPDASMAPDFPAGALAIIKIGASLEPGSLAFIKITHDDGRELGEIRQYKLRGFDIAGKIEEFKAINDAYPSYQQRADGCPNVEVRGRVVEVTIRIKC